MLGWNLERDADPGSNALCLQPSKLEIVQNESPAAKPEWSSLVFGRTFTDVGSAFPSLFKSMPQPRSSSVLIASHSGLQHMLTIPWNAETGWGTPKIEPYGPLALDPSSTVLHYAPTLFE